MARRGHRRDADDRRRVAVSRAVPDGAQGLDRSGMGHVGARPAREALPADAARPQAARRRDGALGALRRCRLEGPAARRHDATDSYYGSPGKPARREEIAEEVADELDFHVEMRTREYIGERHDAARGARARAGAVRRHRARQPHVPGHRREEGYGDAAARILQRAPSGRHLRDSAARRESRASR